MYFQVNFFIFALLTIAICKHHPKPIDGGKKFTKRDLIQAFTSNPTFHRVFQSQGPQNDLRTKFLEDYNLVYKQTGNGDYVFQLPLIDDTEEENNENYDEYDEDEENSNQVDDDTPIYYYQDRFWIPFDALGSQEFKVPETDTNEIVDIDDRYEVTEANADGDNATQNATTETSLAENVTEEITNQNNTSAPVVPTQAPGSNITPNNLPDSAVNQNCSVKNEDLNKNQNGNETISTNTSPKPSTNHKKPIPDHLPNFAQPNKTPTPPSFNTINNLPSPPKNIYQDLVQIFGANKPKPNSNNKQPARKPTRPSNREPTNRLIEKLLTSLIYKVLVSHNDNQDGDDRSKNHINRFARRFAKRTSNQGLLKNLKPGANFPFNEKNVIPPRVASENLQIKNSAVGPVKELDMKTLMGFLKSNSERRNVGVEKTVNNPVEKNDYVQLGRKL